MVEDRYQIVFVVPFGHYEWNEMSQGLKNVPSEFQNIMNDIFYQYMEFSAVYLDNVLFFSKGINQHISHLNNFIEIIKENGLVQQKKQKYSKQKLGF